VVFIPSEQTEDLNILVFLLSSLSFTLVFDFVPIWNSVPPLGAVLLPRYLCRFSSFLLFHCADAFTDLDPLGTGRTRPYVDKKYFFQELKNPPKKLLKELSSGSQAGLGLGLSLGQPDGLFPEESTTISTTTTATNITAGTNQPQPDSHFCTENKFRLLS